MSTQGIIINPLSLQPMEQVADLKNQADNAKKTEEDSQVEEMVKLFDSFAHSDNGSAYAQPDVDKIHLTHRFAVEFPEAIGIQPCDIREAKIGNLIPDEDGCIFVVMQIYSHKLKEIMQMQEVSADFKVHYIDARMSDIMVLLFQGATVEYIAPSVLSYESAKPSFVTVSMKTRNLQIL